MLTYLASSSNDDNNTDIFSSEFFDYFVRKMSLQVGNFLWHSGFLKTVSRKALWRSVTRKIAKCLLKLPKNDFTRKMIGFDTFTKIA